MVKSLTVTEVNNFCNKYKQCKNCPLCGIWIVDICTCKVFMNTYNKNDKELIKIIRKNNNG